MGTDPKPKYVQAKNQNSNPKLFLLQRYNQQHWSSSITASFVDYPYELNPAKLIGSYLGTDSHANNSFLSTGYMHAGIPGVILYGILVGLLFRLIDSLSNKFVTPWVAVAVIIVPSQALLTSADLPTTLLTHGLGIALVILFFA